MTTTGSPVSGVDVLIAEDDPLTRWSLRGLLERQGFSCAEADNGRVAVERALMGPPRCMLLDLGLPELDGFGVARRLRSDPRTRGVAIHCLTGQTDPAYLEQAKLLGCEAFLTKPIDAEVLLGVVRRQLRPDAEWITHLTMTQAQELLDWLENHGCTGLEVNCREETGFAVRCVCPPGFRLIRDESGRAHLCKD
jgi:CheY-like chemotaxis protein